MFISIFTKSIPSVHSRRGRNLLIFHLMVNIDEFLIFFSYGHMLAKVIVRIEIEMKKLIMKIFKPKYFR